MSNISIYIYIYIYIWGGSNIMPPMQKCIYFNNVMIVYYVYLNEYVTLYQLHTYMAALWKVVRNLS